jgi:hypothetical protein
VGFGLLGALVALTPYLGGPWAAAAIAGALVVVAGGCVLAASAIVRRIKTRARRAMTVPLLTFNYPAVLGTSMRQYAALGLGALGLGALMVVRPKFRIWSHQKTGIAEEPWASSRSKGAGKPI